MIIGVVDKIQSWKVFFLNIQNDLSNKTAKQITQFWFDLKFQVEIQIFNRNSIQIEISCFVCNLILSLHITNAGVEYCLQRCNIGT